jgi:hypothetical protein
MRWCGWWIGVLILGIGSVIPALSPAQALPAPATTRPAVSNFVPPVDASLTAFTPDLLAGDVPLLSLQPTEPPSVYAPVEPERPIDGTNKGGVNVDLNFSYLTDDVYRGISHNLAVFNSSINAKRHPENFETTAKVSFNLGKLPHPFVGVFSNIDDGDPVSRFQEIRLFAGLDYSLRPISVSVGVNDYIYPERENVRFLGPVKLPGADTAEIFTRITLDDSYFFNVQKPIISPYVLGVYDYDKNKGWYIELGVKHDFEFPDFGVTLSPYADVAYVSHFPQQFITYSEDLPGSNQHFSSSGFQHYDIGLVGSLSLNHAFHLPPRYGQFALEGYITYTSKFSNPIIANTEVWGGVGLKYRY